MEMTDDEKLKLQLQRLEEISRKAEERGAEADKINDPRKRQEFLLAGSSELSAAIKQAIGRELTESERATADANTVDTLQLFGKYGSDAVQRVLQGQIDEIKKRLGKKEPE